MLMIILVYGISIAVLTTILSYIELVPFFKAVHKLNAYTKAYPSFKNHFCYIFRFIKTLKYAWPPVLDLAIAVACGLMGLAGGVIGALVGLTIALSVSLMVKIHRHWIAPKYKVGNLEDWRHYENGGV